MKAMKWKTGVLAAVLAVSVLTGCGETKENVAGTVTNAANNESETAASTAAEETEAAEERTFSIGSEEGSVYENSYGGFGAEFGDGWKLYSAEELQDLADNMNETYEDGTSIIDMKAENEETLQAVNVNFTKLSITEQAAYSACTEEEIIDELVAEDYSAELATYGASLESVEKTSVTFLGETHFAMKMVATQSGVTVYTTQILNYSRGSWAGCITVESYNEDTTQDVLDMFYAVEE